MPTPMETLDAATACIEAGQVQDGARLAYDAAFRATAEAARRHDRPCKTLEDARKFVCWLEGLPSEPHDPVDNAPLFDLDEDGQPILLPIPEFIGAFDVAEEFKRHAESPTELTSWQPTNMLSTCQRSGGSSESWKPRNRETHPFGCADALRRVPQPGSAGYGTCQPRVRILPLAN